MAHNIHFNEQTGKHSFFSVKEKPWHSLGKVVNGCTSSKKAMEYAALDFGVEKRTLFTSKKSYALSGERLIVQDHFATVRTDNETVLGIVGKEYREYKMRMRFLSLIRL